MASKKLYPHGLVGQQVEIVSSANKSDIGIVGNIVDETKNMIHIAVGKNTKKVFKKNITLKIVKTGHIIDGQTLMRRPEDRIKGK